MSLLDTASLVITPNGTKASKLYSVVPSSGAGDMTVTRATTATRVNSAGLIESVASNVPRLDYSNGTCPSILVEPQRTNILKYSEDLTNAVWSLIGTITRTANYGTAPDGTQTSTRILWGGGANFELYQYSGSALPVFGSLYIKGIAGQTINFNGSIKTFNGDWQRIEELLIIDGSNTYMSIRGIVGGTTALDFQLWGAQGEAGSYATSYIPTTSASVTRNADVISKTGISSLIGQTEGTLFLDFNKTKTYSSSLALPVIIYDSANGINNRIQFLISNDLIELYATDGTNIVYSGGITTLTNGRYKIAVSYGSNGYRVYLNGSSVYTNLATFIPVLNSMRLGSFVTDIAFMSDSINQSTLWKTQLTNTQLAQLTTI